MEKFKISDIQEIFASDVERFHTLTQQYVTQLLNDPTPSQEVLDDALRQCHTLKGLAATVEAWGLSSLGADLEKLLEVAGSWMHNEREKANGIFEFILDHMQDWYVMNQFSCMEMLPQAWDVYQGLRGIMDERWPGYLPSPDSTDSSNAHYVRLAELEIPEAPASAATPEVVESAAPTPVEPTPDLDVQGVEPVASTAEATTVTPQAAPGAPTPVRVVPPTLRSRDKAEIKPPTPLPIAMEGRDVKQDAPIAAAEPAAESEGTVGAPKPLKVKPPTLRSRDQTPATPSTPVANLTPTPELASTPEQPAVPKPLQVVPPSLRRKDASATPQQPEEISAPAEEQQVAPTTTPVTAQATVAPAAPEAPTAPASTPPILRVAPPALKRRAKSTQEPVVSAEAAQAVTPSAPVAETSAVAPTPAEPAAVDAFSAEAIFAALPTEPETVAPVEAAAAVVEQSAATVEEAASPAAAEASVTSAPGAEAEWVEMVRQEVADYLNDLASNLTALAGNLADEAQWNQARRLFHTIKGTAATFKLDAVSTPAKAAELCCVEAAEDVKARTRESFESCVERAQVVAKALGLPFAEQAVRQALELSVAQAQNVAVAQAAPETASLDPEMAGFFINDTRDQIQIIERAVLAWEKGESATEQVWAAQRGFHTIKGAANSIGLMAVAQSVHEVEEHLQRLAGAGAVGSKPLYTFLLGAVDQLRHYLADLTKNTASPWRHDWSTALGLLSQTSTETPATGKLAAAATAVVQAAMVADVGDDDSHTLRIEAARLYQLMNLIGEMVIDRARLARKIEQLTGLQRALAERNSALNASVQNFQQQFEFNLLQANARKSEGSSRKPELGAQKTEAGAPAEANAGQRTIPEFSDLEFDRYDQFNVLARSLVEISHDIEQLNGEVETCLEAFAAENAQFAQTSQQLQSKVTSLSLVPVKTLFPRLQRAFRDALAVEEKQADLLLQGGEAMLDKVVVDKVYGPLLHLVRNAVAHGVEDSKVREQLKKPARGQVRLSATQLANQIVIQLADDGAGINGDAVRKRAVEKGWLAADAPALTPEQVVHFIFQPGFSTATKVTSVSGRGVGLDVVRTEIENLNGSVELRYEPGQGSTWTLRLPLTLAISEAILAKLGEVTYAFPLNFIEYGVVLDAETLVRGEDGSETYVMQAAAVPPTEATEAAKAIDPNSDTSHFARDSVTGASVPVLRLSRVLGVPGDLTSNKGLIVGAGERRAVLVVDVVLARQEIVIKQLDSVLAQHPLLNGATLDAEGRVIPILNLPALLKFAEGSSQKSEAGQTAETEGQKSEGNGLKTDTRASAMRVLVVDDSLSVRKVQERHLRDLGCQVTTATDGLDALEKLRETGGTSGLPFDFVFTDLEMPRLNGYELITEVRGNPAWASLPVVVISSRGADKYITKAMNLGASTFLTKPFTPQQLQEVLRHFGNGQFKS